MQNWLQRYVMPHIEQGLSDVLAMPEQSPHLAPLYEAMRYACLGGGKRIRAALVFAAGEVAPAGDKGETAKKALLPAAVAVELIHAYSLVHDDMPCMDDDALRRGKPTVHVQYGEGNALLVGDALQSLAFESLSRLSIAPALVVKAIRLLAVAAGAQGMVGGQFMDTAAVNQVLTSEQLRLMHQLKTGALIESSVLLGATVVSAGYDDYQALTAYAKRLGLAYQVVDDILDATADTDTLGKTAGKDHEQNKPTYVTMLGLDEAQRLADDLHEQAMAVLLPLGERAKRLRGLADLIIRRDH